MAKPEELTPVYDGYCAAVRKKDFEAAGAFLTEKFRSELYPPEVGQEELADMADMIVAMIPVSYTMDHLDSDAVKASLYITAKLNNQRNPGTTARLEMMVAFNFENGAWKMAGITYMMDPDQVKKSPEQDYEPKENFDFSKNTSMGGRVVFVKFEKDYTLVGIRMLDEEDLVFLPGREELEKSGLKTDRLAPWKTLKVDGHPHRTKPMKVWGEKAEFVEEAA